MFNFLKLSATKPQVEITASAPTSTITSDEHTVSVTEGIVEATISGNIQEANASDKLNSAVETATTTVDDIADTASIETPLPLEELKSTSTVEEYLSAHGFKIDYSRAGEYDLVCDSVKEIAYYIFEHHELISDFLGFLRIRLAKDGFVSYSMERLSAPAKEETVKFAKEVLTPNGLLSNTYVNYNTSTITATIPGAKRIHAFITGGWLEIVARTTVEEVVSKRAKELGVDYQIFSNLMVEKDGKHELDVVFKLSGGRMCWIECKSSGKFNDFTTFYQTGVDLSTIPTYTLLLFPCTDSHASSIGYYYDIHCSNLNKDLLYKEINTMLNKSINN